MHLPVAGRGYNHGVWGVSASGNGVGVSGVATHTSGLNYGVIGSTYSPNGYAGYFYGRVHITGSLYVEGSKHCVQEIEGAKKVTLYVMESLEYWFEDFGTGQLVNGQAVVQIDRVFAQTTNTGVDYYVFLTPKGECQGLYISRQDKDSFEVRELGGGTSSISLYYRIVAKRRGYEEVRFEEFTEPKEPPIKAKLLKKIGEAKVKEPKNR